MFKDIMVHVGTAEFSRKRIDMAARIASLHGAHLTGVHPLTPPRVPMYLEVQLAGSFWDTMDSLTKTVASEAEKIFEDVCRGEGVEAEWRAVPGQPSAVMADQVRFSDMIVVGQPNPETPSAFSDLELPADIALGGGRPVLVVPHTGDFKAAMPNVLVAWNGSREAARAVHDSMPLLRAANRVNITYVKSGRKDEVMGDLPGAQLALHLARHGIEAESAPVTGDSGHAGELLLSAAADLSADLIVMGAYGRPRLSELVLGGVTRHILEHMTVPVLMSH